jgi:hypothetical protein
VFPLPTTTEGVSWSGNIHPAPLETHHPQRTTRRASIAPPTHDIDKESTPFQQELRCSFHQA